MTLTKQLATAVALACALLAGQTPALAAPTDGPRTATHEEKTLYERLGGDFFSRHFRRQRFLVAFQLRRGPVVEAGRVGRKDRGTQNKK